MVIVVEFVYSGHQIMNEGELKINQDNNSKIWVEMIVASFLDAIVIDDIHTNKQLSRETTLYISNHKESISFEKKVRNKLDICIPFHQLFSVERIRGIVFILGVPTCVQTRRPYYLFVFLRVAHTGPVLNLFIRNTPLRKMLK